MPHMGRRVKMRTHQIEEFQDAVSDRRENDHRNRYRIGYFRKGSNGDGRDAGADLLKF